MFQTVDGKDEKKKKNTTKTSAKLQNIHNSKELNVCCVYIELIHSHLSAGDHMVDRSVNIFSDEIFLGIENYSLLKL